MCVEGGGSKFLHRKRSFAYSENETGSTYGLTYVNHMHKYIRLNIYTSNGGTHRLLLLCSAHDICQHFPRCVVFKT